MARETKRELFLLCLRIAASLALALLGSLLLNEENFPFYVNLIVMLSSWVIISYDVVWNALKETFAERKPFNEYSLMTIASIGAFLLRAFGKDHNEYLEAVLVMLLYQVGEFFSEMAEEKSRNAVTSALDLKKEKAKVLGKDGTYTEVGPEEMKVGDVFALCAGNKVLCDSTILSGNGLFDESSLTGEPIPVEKKEGDPIVSGTILTHGEAKARVEKAYADSAVFKMSRLVEEAKGKKSKADRFITRFSKIYTPIVMLLALVVMVLPPLIQGAGNKDIWSRWIYTSLSFLVVSCPCAVVISVPLSYVSGIGLASKYGILVKGATYFDRLASLKTVGFDKTGTLTTGKMSLALVKPRGIDEDTFMDYLSAAESESSHPIAIAVEKARQGNPSLVSDYEEVEGKGVKCTYKGHKLKVGKKSFLEDESIEESEGEGTALYLSVDGEYSGYALLSDTMREEVPALISSLRKEGIRTVLISGDRKQNAEALASALSIDAVYSGLLPKEKTDVIEKEKKGGTMAYLGDGVNDAASLSLADVGIAMGGLGSDLAVENADVVILDDNPGKLEKLIRISGKTKNMAISNVVVAILVKVTIMILNLVIPSLPLWISVLGDTGLTFLLVLRSMALFMLGKPNKNKK